MPLRRRPGGVSRSTPFSWPSRVAPRYRFPAPISYSVSLARSRQHPVPSIAYSRSISTSRACRLRARPYRSSRMSPDPPPAAAPSTPSPIRAAFSTPPAASPSPPSRVSARTVYKWLDRYEREGEAGLLDRSSRPTCCPHATSAGVVRQIDKLRRRRLTAWQISRRLAVPRSTVLGVAEAARTRQA